MSKTHTRGPSAAEWITGAVCLVLATVVLGLIPSSELTQRPFAVEVAVGEQGVGRPLAATVTEVQLADELRAGPWVAEANWFVADVVVEAMLSEPGTALNYASLLVHTGGEGDREYRATERVSETLLKQPLTLGSTQRGQLAFELPEGVAGLATLRLGVNTDPRVDSVIEVPVALDELERVHSRTLSPVEWGSR